MLTTNIPCLCKVTHRPVKLVVLTGGPGAGKTAILELAKKQLCQHIAILPESASIVYGGGFWRMNSLPAKLAAQRAIFHVQSEMEALVQQENIWALGLCDRGTIDGLAYWPEKEKLYWDSLATSKQQEFDKYSAVIHLRTPTMELGYNHQNPIRTETAAEAAVIDAKIAEIWSSHPRYTEIKSEQNFFEKARRAIALILAEVPACCKVKTGPPFC